MRRFTFACIPPGKLCLPADARADDPVAQWGKDLSANAIGKAAHIVGYGPPRPITCHVRFVEN